MIIITRDNGKSTSLPNPVDYEATLTDLNKSAERAGGYVVRKRQRERVWAIAIGWELLTPADVIEIMEATRDEEFTVCFDAPTPTFSATATMYCGPVTMRLTIHNSEDKPDEKRYSLTLDLIEV